MADFQRSLQRLLNYEGGYSNNAADRGGETKWGISKSEFPDVDIANLTYADMQILYKRNYWDPLRLDDVNVQSIAEEVFEQAANFGVERAARHCQRALNYFRENPIAVDGFMGMATAQAVNTCTEPALVLMVLNGLQLGRYLAIVDNDPSQKIFIRGWLKRVELARTAQ